MAVKEHSRRLNDKLKELEEKIKSAPHRGFSIPPGEEGFGGFMRKSWRAKLGLMAEQLKQERAEKEQLLSELKRTDGREGGDSVQGGRDVG